MSASAPSQRPAGHGTRTLTAAQNLNPGANAGPSNPEVAPGGEAPPVGVLRLRGGPNQRQKVVWSDETVDNEGMGKKKSKSKSFFFLISDFRHKSDD